MEWEDHGVVLCARPHGEDGAIVDLFTATRGRHSGLVRGGRSRRLRPVLQPGNTVSAVWRARLESHLGTYRLELTDPRAGRLMDDPFSLAGLSSVCAVASALPEREAHDVLYHAFEILLNTMGDTDIWPAVMVRWELGLLQELGFRLELDRCAVTGSVGDLVYVSPKSGRAVSREAGAAYRDRLLRLPGFVHGIQGHTDLQAVADGFRLTGHFMKRHIFGPFRGRLPDARVRLEERLRQRLAVS